MRTALVDLHDFWLASRCAAIGLTDRASLVAVGALGRRELAPYSDLDLVLLHDGRKDVDRLAEELWYPLWNSGIGLDHSVRTPGQAVQVAATDLRAAFGLLEARHLAGDPELSEKVGSAVRQAWRAGIRGRYEEIAEGAHERWRKSGDVAHRVEPDLKSGHGGLRDVQLIDALAAAQLVDRPSRDVLDGRDLLLDVRTELHRMAGRARDVLRAQDADEVAASLDIADRFELARALSGAARSVAFAAEVGLRQARNALPRRGLAALRRPPVRRPLDSGVVEHGGEVALARDATAVRDPALVLRVAATAARTGLPVAAGTLHRLADTAPELREPWPRAARGELLSLLGTGRPLVDVVESLDRTGLWGRLFPEWGAVRDLPPRDRAHVWTVDRHLVETCAQAARLTTQVARPDLLLIGSLLHDIGKGRGGDHSVVGESLAVQIGRRLGFADADVAVLGAVVRHHLLLPHTATRRDLEDQATVVRVVETLEQAVPGAGALLLDLLGALAEADSLATGPGVWSPWKRVLIGDLVARCRALLAGEALPAPTAPSTAEIEMAAAVAAEGRPQLRLETGDPATVTVALPKHRTGGLAAAAGVLALHSLVVHAAAVLSADVACPAVTVLRFTVTPALRRLPRPGAAALEPGARARRQPRARRGAGAQGAGLRPAAASGEPAAPARVLWFDDEATGAVVMELRGTDRIGLLHRVAAALARCDIGLRWARVSTLGASVVDAFCLDTDDGTVGLPQRRLVERAVLTAAR